MISRSTLIALAKAVLIGYAALLVSRLLLYHVGAPGLVVIHFAQVAGFIAFLWVFSSRRKPARAISHSDFTPAFQSRNIALDTERGKLWLRDASGRERVFAKDEILRWKTSSVQLSRRADVASLKNAIEIDVRDLASPRWRIEFDSYSRRFFGGERENASEMEDWFSRLTTWMNNTR